MENPDELLTVNELAEALRVPVSWVYARTRVDALPCYKVGKYLRFRLPEVIQTLERRGHEEVETR